MTIADELREAAELMRERANAVYPRDLPWNELVMGHSGTAVLHALGWTPAVALAVADWIDSHARDLGSSGDLAMCDSPGDVQSALTVARAYLGGAS